MKFFFYTYKEEMGSTLYFVVGSAELSLLYCIIYSYNVWLIVPAQPRAHCVPVEGSRLSPKFKVI